MDLRASEIVAGGKAGYFKKHPLANQEKPSVGMKSELGISLHRQLLHKGGVKAKRMEI